MKTTKISLILPIIAFFSVLSYSQAQATTTTDDTADASVVSSASTEINQDNSPIISSPSTDLNQDNSPVITSSPSTDLNQDGPATTTPPTTPTDTSTGSSGSFSGSYSGGSSSSGSSITSVNIINSAINFGTCPLITTFLQSSANNDTKEVLKLQAFLKNTEGITVDFTGVFDVQTVSAVKSFQAKYLTDTMGPWKATLPSGIVYITTKKKINEIACKTPLTLSADELSIINSYGQNNPTNTPVIGQTTIGESIGESIPTSANPFIGENQNLSTTTSNTASVVNAPILQRVWHFIKGIFGK